MSEINEKDLEQVTGGAGLDVRDWERKNCAVCNRSDVCSPDVKRTALALARRALEEGTEYICSGARSYYSHNQ